MDLYIQVHARRLLPSAVPWISEDPLFVFDVSVCVPSVLCVFRAVVLFFFDWVGVLWPQLSKVLKLVRWARRVLFPTVSLARQVTCLFAAVVWTPMC